MMIFCRGDGGFEWEFILPLGDQMLPDRWLFKAPPTDFAVRGRKLAARTDFALQAKQHTRASLADGLRSAIAAEEASLRQRMLTHTSQRSQAIGVKRTQ